MKKWVLIVVPVLGLLIIAGLIYWFIVVRKEGQFTGLLMSEISGMDFLLMAGAILLSLAILMVFVKILPMEKLYDENVRLLADSYGLGFLAAYFIPNAFAEEIIFRGAVQSLIGLVPAAIVFTLIHVSYYKKPLMLVEAFLQALVLGGLMYITGSLWITTIAHAAFNWIQMWCIKTDRVKYYDNKEKEIEG